MNRHPAPSSIGRHLLPAVLLTTTAAGLIGLLDHPSAGGAEAGGDGADNAAADSSVSPDATQATLVPPPSSATTAPDTSAGAPGVTVPFVDDPAPGADPTPAPIATEAPAEPATAAPDPTSGGGCDTAQTVDGDTVDTKWGPVQVEAAVTANGKICEVQAIQSPNSHRKSLRINQRALPILHDEAISAQSADIQAVSRATITSRAYKRSLQSILDQVGG